MEIAKKAQENKIIASGFCTLRDKSGNWISQTASMGQDKQFTHGQDLPFHPCKKIKEDLAKRGIEILLPCQNGYALNGQVKIDGAEQDQAQNIAPINNMERRQGINR